jgi:hypothetical protein
MGRLAEEIEGVQECAHGGGELSDDGQDNVESFFGRAAIGRLTLPPAVKGLHPAEDVFVGEIAGP